MISKINNILIVKFSSLGDILHTTPFVETISKKYNIYYLTSVEHRKLLKNNPKIKKVFTVDELKIELRLPLKILRNIFTVMQLLFYRIRVSVNLHKLYKLNLLFKMMGITTYGLVRKPDDIKRSFLNESIVFDQKEHHIKQYLKFADMLGIKEKHYSMEFYPHSSKTTFKVPSEKYITLCAGGGQNRWASMPSKRWPIENYITISRQMFKEYGIQTVLLGGQSDLEIHKKMKDKLGAEIVFDFTNRLTLDQVYSVIKGSKLYIGNDSFLLHFASATGGPTLGLFGPTSGELLAPLGGSDKYIQSSGECSMCYDANQGIDSRAYKCDENECMKDISVAIVVEHISEVLGLPVPM